VGSNLTIVVSRSAAPVAGAAEAVAADGDISTLRLAFCLQHAFRLSHSND
jgi:hypothetical protein